MNLTKRDIELLRCLRTNARATLTQISKKTKIPISTLYEHLKRQEKNFISKHTTLIDFSQLGYTTRMQMFIKAPKEIRERIQSYLSSHHQINTVSRVSTSYDLFAEAIFKHIQEAQEFKEEMERRFPQAESNSHFVVKDIIREAFLAESNSNLHTPIMQNLSTQS